MIIKNSEKWEYHNCSNCKADISQEESDKIEKVVLEKARTAFKKLKKPLIVDDTAIYFEEYKNFPGTYTNSVFNLSKLFNLSLAFPRFKFDSSNFNLSISNFSRCSTSA